MTLRNWNWLMGPSIPFDCTRAKGDCLTRVESAWTRSLVISYVTWPRLNAGSLCGLPRLLLERVEHSGSAAVGSLDISPKVSASRVSRFR